MVTRRRRLLVAGAAILLVAGVALFAAFGQSNGDAQADGWSVTKLGNDPDARDASSQADTPGEGPLDGAEAYFSAVRSYPADEIPPTISHTAKLTFDAIAKKGDSGNNHWYSYGPKQSAVEPGVLAFSGATNTTASRVTAMVIAPTCAPGNCRLWVGVSGGGVWRTDDALAADPSWTYLTAGIAQNSVGTLTAAPSDPTGNTLYLGTGEANRCGSGCEAGVGIYKSTNGGSSWTKLADSCTSNPTYACVTPGQDAFLGRSISKIVVDPANPNHLYVGSALGVRGLSHVIGNGGTTRFPPNANNVGLYESTDGGATFTEVWNGNGSTFGVIDVGLDPLDASTVYASAFDQGLWRRSAALDGSSTPYDFHQVFAPRNPGGGTDRTMFAATVKNAKTRLYLTDGTAGSASVPSEFWRTDNANQPAAALLASEGPGATEPPPPRDSLPGGLQRLAEADLQHDREPVLPDVRLLHRPVLVRPTRLHAGRDARHRLRDRLVQLRRASLQHEGRRLRERSFERPGRPVLDNGRRSGCLGNGNGLEPDVYRPHLRHAERPVSDLVPIG